ncbi:DUF6873 family GME fold protein [uncultured Ruminococcus sp.]|uniref:DUF6873 family GME fold protein n=1 Tax=uncultured Ruminococcus sp. TaxID=165186 RepID=UPI0025EEE7D5|nr:hypothetical protein [uncultured Ruminococcus sp.]
MNTFVMSDKYPCFVKEIEKFGHTVISSDRIDIFPFPEQKHADMQILPINNDIFILNECTVLAEKLSKERLIFCNKKAGKKYPENILLNFLYLNNTLYGKLSAIDENLLDYCKENNIKTVNINQGYARCSTLVLNKNAIITSDLSIEKALKKDGIEVLLISSGNIVLDGYNYGFIGGASGKIDEDTVAFFGNATNHPDYRIIEKFCKNQNISINILCKDMPLTDIGGMVKI